jgi:beta-glucosidase
MTTDARYRDPQAPIDERVEDLLARMTLDEKLAQITSTWLTSLVQGNTFDADHVAAELEHGIGHVTRIGASTGLRPEASARLMNQIQRVVIERTRLGIPVMVHEEGVAGYCARDATLSVEPGAQVVDRKERRGHGITLVARTSHEALRREC